MIDCKISFPKPLTHLLHIELRFHINNQSSLDLILPAWRPGRYELAPFVENIQGFTVLDSKSNSLKWRKNKPNIWTVQTENEQEIVVRYQYYANRMDAGNSVLNDQMIYINFINCVFFTKKHQNDSINLKVDIPINYRSSCSLTKTDSGDYLANNHQQLVDSPILASPDLKLLSYSVDDYYFAIALLGDCPLTENELITDFKKFSESQIAAMGGFPTNQYDFLIHSLDYPHYHGVEHQNSTVLVLGPNDKPNRGAYYEKLMGVASHELFHTWNVTRIRPKEMSPYRFEKETMTATGFVTEGFTTYYGDLFLKQSGVFDQQDYFKELNTLFNRHFENFGRHESSLVQSSENLWVDGYKSLFPSKKVSIYVKGALCALILDLKIRKNTSNECALIDVVKKLYQNHTYEKGGYTKKQVEEIIIEIGGPDISALISSLYKTTEELDSYLSEALSYVGCELKPKTHPDIINSKLGIKLNGIVIVEIAPKSHTEDYLSVGDEILKINNEIFSDAEISLMENNKFQIKRGPRTLDVMVPRGNQTYYDSYEILLMKEASDTQRENLSLWLGNN